MADATHCRYLELKGRWLMRRPAGGALSHEPHRRSHPVPYFVFTNL